MTDAGISGAAQRGVPARFSLPELKSWVERRFDLAVAAIEFVRHGENTTFRVRGQERDYALRLYRPGYQVGDSIRSELAWTSDLSAKTEISTPAAVSGRDGELIQSHGGELGHRAVLFEWVEGVPIGELNRADLWRRLGQLMAIIHEHGQRWRRPPCFTRPAWDLDAFVGPQPRWGDPVSLIDWGAAEATLVSEAREMVRRRLLGFGTDPERYGLIHADLAFENVLVNAQDETSVLDFDDGGPGWFVYDLAVSLFPRETEPGFNQRRDALIEGYRGLRPLSRRSVVELPTFLMARRLATLGWTFSRGETAHANRLRYERVTQAPERCRAFLEWAGSR